MPVGSVPLGTVAYLGGVHSMPREFLWSWGQMIQYNAEFITTQGVNYIHYDKVDYSDHAPARNHLANITVGNWLLQLDTDHQFEPDLLDRILHRANTYRVDVIAGFYQLKKQPHYPVVWTWNEKHEMKLLAKWDPRIKLMEIAAAGAGALWVRRSVFDRIRNELNEEPFDRYPATSEDHSFFRRLDKLGIKAWCDPRIQVNHLRTVGVDYEDLDLSSMPIEENPTEAYGD